ncbi:MAG TPA: DUF481 domain-containing protein [Pyrinomonadaceae bacterium]|nr:DUF481 domain-containing protein [Pyrinomonadaceae bacterium]
MPKHLTFLLLPVYALIVSPLSVYADRVELKNGDRVSGTVVKRDAEVVEVETPYAGVITIAASHVENVVIGEAVKTAAEQKPITPKPDTLKPVPQLFGDGPMLGIASGWEGNANIGFSYTSGNTRTATMTTGVRAVKAGDNENITVYARSLWNTNRNSSNRVTTSNAVWGGIRYDKNISDQLFAFGAYDFERDRPKKLNFRSVAGAGLGHHAVKNETTEWDLLLGGAWNRSWQVGNDTDVPEATLGSSLKHKLGPRLKIQKTFTMYQNVTDKAEYRFIFDATVSVDITKRIGWFITTGDRFNNDPIGTAKKNDFLFTTGMKWNFGAKK